MVDDNRAEGTAKSMGGKVQDAVGGLTGDLGTQAKGKLNQAAGAAQDAFGSAMDTADDWSGNLGQIAKDKPLTALLVALSIGFAFRVLTHTGRR